ncbi:MAG: hypothetical protein R3A79_05790 [Nannocystaceae bacterium]
MTTETPKTPRFALLLTAFVALTAVACDAEPSDAIDTVDVESALLRLDDGGEVLFLADADGEVKILAAGGPSGVGHLAPLHDGATPAELWVSLSGAGAEVEMAAEADAIPAFLVDHHESTVARALDLELALPTPRGLSYPGNWGGTAGYCANSFAADFEAYNPEPTEVIMASDELSYYAYSEGNISEAYVAVCNDRSKSESGTLSGLRLSVWGGTRWLSVGCNSNVCLSVLNQEAQAVYFWTSNPGGDQLRIQAKNTGGVVHTTMLRAGFVGVAP